MSRKKALLIAGGPNRILPQTLSQERLDSATIDKLKMQIKDRSRLTARLHFHSDRAANVGTSRLEVWLRRVLSIHLRQAQNASGLR